jgi:hypothetical protein
VSDANDSVTTIPISQLQMPEIIWKNLVEEQEGQNRKRNISVYETDA